MIFWDTSALVKCYFGREAGHARARSLLLSGRRHRGSVLLEVEATSGIVRRHFPDRRNADAVLDLLREHLGWFSLLAVDGVQIERATRLARAHGLRGADAIHLAAAAFMDRELRRSRLRFATADADQAEAARGEDLRVIELPR